MDDNLPKDPPNSGNGNGTPPPFGSSFDPHTNPVDPNNPYQSQPPQNPVPPNPPNLPNQEAEDKVIDPHQSEVAKHQARGPDGKFVSSEHTINPHPKSSSEPASSLSAPSNSSFLPPIIEVNQNTQPSSKKDPPLFGFFLTNPVTYLKIFLNKLIKRQAVTIKIPVLVILMVMIGIGGYGLGFKSGINYMLGQLFPTFSPILHRAITAQGTIQKSSNGYYLLANDKNKTLWTLKPVSANINLADYVDQKVQIKGNLTPTPNLIEVSEVISFNP